MAIAITWEGNGKVTDADTTTGFAVIKATSGGGTPSPALADGGLQGATSAQAITTTSNNKLILLYYDLGAGNELDFRPEATNVAIDTTGGTPFNMDNVDDIIAQSFQIGAAQACYISRILLNLTITGSPKIGLEVLITEDSSGNPSLAEADIIATSGICYMETAATANGISLKNWKKKLSTSTTYWIVVRIVDPITLDVSNYIVANYNNAGSYANGNVKTTTNGGTSWTNIPAGDLQCTFYETGAEFGESVWVWGNFLASSLLQLQEAEGFGVVLGNTTNWGLYNFFGNDNYSGGWVRMKVDPASMEAKYRGSGSSGSDTTAGFSNTATVRYIGVFGYTSATARFDNLIVDRMDVGLGYRVTGTTVDNLVPEILALEESVANWWGNIVRSDEQGSTVELNGDLKLGDDGGTLATTIDALNSSIIVNTPQAFHFNYGNCAHDFNYLLNKERNRIAFVGNGTGATTINIGTKVGTGDDTTGISGLSVLNSTDLEYPTVRSCAVRAPDEINRFDANGAEAIVAILHKSVIDPNYELSSIVVPMWYSGSPSIQIAMDIILDNGSGRYSTNLNDIIYQEIKTSFTSADFPYAGAQNTQGIVFRPARTGNWIPYEEWTDFIHILIRVNSSSTLNSTNYFIFRGNTGAKSTMVAGGSDLDLGPLATLHRDAGTNTFSADGLPWEIRQKRGGSCKLSFNDGNVNDANVYGSSFRGISGGLDLGDTAAHEFAGNTVDSSAQVDLGNVPTRNCNFVNYKGFKGALLWNGSIDLKNSQFISNEHAIEHPTAGAFSYIGLNFTDNTYDILNSVNADVEDSHPVANEDAIAITIGPSSVTAQGQSFTATNSAKLTSVEFRLRKTGAPTGNAVAKLYAHSGSYGTSSVPTGAALATSKPFDVSTLSTTVTETIKFDFDDSEYYTMTAATNYVIVLEYTNGDGTNYIRLGTENATPSHSGNRSQFAGTWAASILHDLIFYVYGSGDVTINATDSNPSEAKSYETGKGTTNVNNAVTLEITVVDADNGDAVIQNAQTSMWLTSDRTQLMNEDTNASGVASESYNYSGNVQAELRVRKSEATDSPRYRAFSELVTITANGYSRTVRLRRKTIGDTGL